jgi:hypothetical protein
MNNKIMAALTLTVSGVVAGFILKKIKTGKTNRDSLSRDVSGRKRHITDVFSGAKMLPSQVP